MAGCKKFPSLREGLGVGLMLNLFMWFLYLLFILFFPPKTYAASTNVSATIATNNPPTITFITPVNNQTGVPADADIVVEISEPSYGVDINSVEIIINGVTYTPSSPRVSVTGDILDYTFTVTPYDPLFTNQANTVLVKATNLNANSTQSSIVFNVPVITPTPTPTPTTTSSPTETPTPTPTSTSIISTPTPTPTSTYYSITTPKITQKPTVIYPPSCPTCPTCSNNESIEPTPTPTQTQTDIPDITSPIIAFIKPPAKGLLKTNDDFVFQVSDLGSGVDQNTIKVIFNQQVFTLTNTQMDISGNNSSFRITLKNKFQLLPNTEYRISVSAFDFSQNGISKSIFFQVTKPFPYLSLLLIIPIAGLVWLIIFLIKYFRKNENSQTIGFVFNSITLEPIPFIKISINNKNYYSNIFGIVSVNLNPGDYNLNIKDPNFSFPSKNDDQPLDFPHPYQGELFEIKSKSLPFLNIALDPYKNKNIFYKISQFFLGKSGTITSPTGEPLTGTKIALIETKFKTIITNRIIDNEGHYRFIVPHGRYQLIVFGTNTIIDTIDTRHKVFGYTLINKNYTIKI